METVGNYPDLAAARLAQSVLAASGIESEVPDAYLAGVHWQIGTALHGIVLRVRPEDADSARAILEQTFAEERAEDPFGDSDCRLCGDDGPESPRWKRRLKAASLLFPPLVVAYALAAFLVPTPTCPSCGRR